MIRSLRAARDRMHNSDGLTLIELLISMAIFSVAIAMVFTVLVKVEQKTSGTQQSADAVAQLRAGLQDLDKQVRSGNVLYTPKFESNYLSSCHGGTLASPASVAGDYGDCMRVFTQENGNQNCVQWQVYSPSSPAGPFILRTRSWDPQYITSLISTPWHTVARGLTLTVGNLSTYPFSTPPTAGIYGQRLLHVSFTVIDQRSGKPASLESSLSGRNTTYGYDSGLCTDVPPG